jgi:MFS family permease
MFRSLRERNYRRYVFGHAVSVIGTWMQRVGQDWLVLELTHSGVALGITLALQFLPILLGGVWGGVVVDRVDKRKLIIATQAAQAFLAAVLAVVTIAGVVNLATVFVMAFLLGVVSVFDVPARQAFVSELVDEGDVVNAMALASLVHNTGRLVGPAFGGLVIAWTGVGQTFALNAVSFVAVLIGLTIIDPSGLRREPPMERAPGQARAGLRYVWQHPELRIIMLLVAFVAVFGQNFRVVLPLLAADTFDGDARTYGLLTSALGLGAVIGALVSASATRPTARGLFASCGIFGVANVLGAVAPVLSVVLVAMVGVGAANIVFNTYARTLLQLRSDRSLHGRVMAIHSLVFLGSTPIGAPLVGAVCAVAGARSGLVVAAVFSLVPAAVLLAVGRRHLDQDAA